MVVHQEEASALNMLIIDSGSRATQANLRVKLHERHATCHLDGLYWLTQDHQTLDNQIQIDHIADNGTSSMFYKGVLDKKSRALFNGKVHVHENAQQTNALQANHNLLLSKYAEVRSEPQLEIYSNDIKCAHGATVGQLDAEALFYLRSRGIEANLALQLLTEAFTREV